MGKQKGKQMSSEMKMKEFTLNGTKANGKFRVHYDGDNIVKIVAILGKRNIVVSLDELELFHNFFEALPETVNNKTMKTIIDKIVPLLVLDEKGNNEKIKAIIDFRNLMRCSLVESKQAIKCIMDYGYDFWEKRHLDKTKARILVT